MFATRLVAALVVALAAGVTAPAGAEAQQTDGARPLTEHPRVRQAANLIDVWAEAELAYEQVPGASLAVVHDQERIWAGAWGMARPDEEVPATPETLYSICSISKLFTSVSVMDLWEEGALELNDRVGEHLPWFDLEERHDGLSITLEGLLTHSSGLPRESDSPYWSPPDFDFPTREQMRRRLSEQETLYPAGRYFQYSNLGLSLAGAVVEEVAGEPYEAHVRSRVLDPLGLDHTSPSIPWEHDRMASGFGGMTRDGTREPVPAFEADGIAPAAGYASSVLDLARFASWQFRLLDGDTTEVLEPSTLEKMHNVHWVDPDWDVHWGLGFSVWRSDDETYVGHGGSCPGFRSHLALLPSREIGAAFAANAGGVDSDRFTGNAIRILAPALEAARDTAKEPESPPPEFERFTGTYSNRPWGGETAVIPWKDGLAMVGLPTDDPLEALDELEHVEERTFRRVRENGDLGETVRFRVDDSGRVDALIHHSNVSRRISVERR